MRYLSVINAIGTKFLNGAVSIVELLCSMASEAATRSMEQQIETNINSNDLGSRGIEITCIFLMFVIEVLSMLPVGYGRVFRISLL